MKRIIAILRNPHQHWVGDGFPVRTLFSYDTLGSEVSPFLLLDFAGPAVFQATAERRGVGKHPHRGFETVTIVYDGEVAHRDSAGNAGVIGAGDVQWMTAGRGILHEEFHGARFARSGGAFLTIQLWVNLPASAKGTPPSYQGLTATEIPVIPLPGDAGSLRIIAGEFDGVRGAASTFTPINAWDVVIRADRQATFDLPEGHTALVVVVNGRFAVNGAERVSQGEGVLLEREGSQLELRAIGTGRALVLSGEPIDEPIVGRGPFVMNTAAEIEQAIIDYRSGGFGRMPSG